MFFVLTNFSAQKCVKNICVKTAVPNFNNDFFFKFVFFTLLVYFYFWDRYTHKFES